MRRSPFWYCAFYLPDGTRTLRSTGTSDKRKATAICLEWERASKVGREGRLSELQTRKVMAHIFAVANGETLPSATLADFLATWLRKKSLEVEESSLREYQGVVNALRKHFKAKADKPLDAITRRDAAGFRDSLAKRVAGSTVNKHLKICRVAWGDAVKESVCRENVFAQTALVKARKSNRRAFTLPEFHRILAACCDEWRGMVIVGLYTGQRSSDVSTLTWRQIDLAAGEIRFVTRKTKKPLTLPIHPAMMRYFMERPSADDPDAALFPSLNGLGSNTLARQFSEILMEAGLVQKRTHASRGKGRATRRDVGGLSFHCLRHTATSLLKNAGVSDVVAREIVGHESEAVSRVYTHIETGTLREAVNKLPDVIGAKV
jgi:integrase